MVEMEDWQHIIKNGVTDDGTLRELYLYKIPVLKTVDNWNDVIEIGKVDFRGKHAEYKGGLVNYAEKIYFVPDARLNALSPFRKWKFKTDIKIISEDDFKKKKK